MLGPPRSSRSDTRCPYSTLFRVLGFNVDVVIFEDSLYILFQCDCSLVATAITHDEHRRPRPARAGMFLVDDPRGLEREVARLEPAARQVPAISQDHPELVAAMVIDRTRPRLNSSHSCTSRMPSSACTKKTVKLIS